MLFLSPHSAILAPHYAILAPYLHILAPQDRILEIVGMPLSRSRLPTNNICISDSQDEAKRSSCVSDPRDLSVESLALLCGC